MIYFAMAVAYVAGLGCGTYLVVSGHPYVGALFGILPFMLEARSRK